MIDYLDEDVAYLLGLLIPRGEIIEQPNNNQIIWNFPYKRLEAEGLKTSYDLDTAIRKGIWEKALPRLEGLIGFNLQRHVDAEGKNVRLIAKFAGKPMTWRNINMLLNGRHHFTNFLIPQQIFEADSSIKKEFMRGFADTCGYIRKANAYVDKCHRIYFEIPHENWTLPIQICNLLQHHLKVPVQHILWGHPNIRTPNEHVNDPNYNIWAKEHDLRVFAEEFEKVGFYFDYKNTILKEFADFNKKLPHGAHNYCNPEGRKIRKGQKSPKHAAEGHPNLPIELRSKHFNATWQICLKLGCKGPSEKLENFK